MMCLKKQDLYNKFKGRVQAVSPSSKSPWVESEYVDYLFEGRSVGKGLSGRLSIPSRSYAQWYCSPDHLSSTYLKQRAAPWGQPL